MVNVRGACAMRTSHRRVHRALMTFIVGGGLALTAATARSVRAVTQEASRSRVCNFATLRGKNGVLVSGVRAIGPTATKSFVAVGVRTFDGNGAFTDVASFHGAVVPPVRGGHVAGTYHVNPDCTGKSSVQPPAPFPTIDSDFVILVRGRTITRQ